MTWKDVITAFIAILIIVMFGGVFAILLLRPITLSEGSTALVNMAFGFLGAAFGAVVTFYFGSSASSQKKDDTIHDAFLMTKSGTGNGEVKPPPAPTVISGSPGQSGAAVGTAKVGTS